MQVLMLAPVNIGIEESKTKPFQVSLQLVHLLICLAQSSIPRSMNAVLELVPGRQRRETDICIQRERPHPTYSMTHT